MAFWKKGLLPLLACAVLIVGFGSHSAKAQQTRKVQTMSFAVLKQMESIQTAIDTKNIAKAKQLIETALNREQNNEYENSILWQYSALVAFEENDTASAIAAYEQVLQFRQYIPQAQEHQIVFGLAQLYYTDKNYDKAQELATVWQLTTDVDSIGVAQWQFLALLAYNAGDYGGAIDKIDSFFTTANSEQRNSRTAKNIYVLLASAYWEQGNYQGSLEAIRNVIPDTSYTGACGVAAGAYEALGVDKETALVKTRDEHQLCLDVTELTTATDFLHENRETPSPTPPEVLEDQELSQLPLNASTSTRYPQRASEEGIQGYALLEFNIEGDGSVDPASISVLEAKPSGYFEEAAIQQAAKFRYRPKILNGERQAVEGIKYRFSYNLDKLSRRSSNAKKPITPRVQPLIFVQPVYPRKAQEEKIEGYVIVEFTVKKNGKVSKRSIKIIEAEPMGYFEEAAIEAMKAMRYVKPKVNGKSKKMENVRHRFTFNLAKD